MYIQLYNKIKTVYVKTTQRSTACKPFYDFDVEAYHFWTNSHFEILWQLGTRFSAKRNPLELNIT